MALREDLPCTSELLATKHKDLSEDFPCTMRSQLQQEKLCQVQKNGKSERVSCCCQARKKTILYLNVLWNLFEKIKHQMLQKMTL